MRSREVVLIDGASLHHVMDAIAVSQEKGQVRLDFSAMHQVCLRCLAALRGNRREEAARRGKADPREKAMRRPGQDLEPVDSLPEMRLYTAIDPGSDAQKRLAQSWEAAGFTFVGIDFRASSPSPSPKDPAGRAPTSDMAIPIAYALGTLRRFESVKVLVVSHAFGLAMPLLDLKSNDRVVGLACFKTYLDLRWHQRRAIGLGDDEIPFFDLEEEAQALLGRSLTGDLERDRKGGGLGF
jgi:hypothetical protein